MPLDIAGFRQNRLSPVQAEVTFTVPTDVLSPAEEVCGRVTGPFCRFSSTVEIAYPLRQVGGGDHGQLQLRGLIPEPNLWDPQSPFLYKVWLERRQEGERRAQVPWVFGLRELHLGGQGLRWNGRLCPVRGTMKLPRSPAEALRLRDRGINLLVVPAEERETWTLAGEFGFLVLGQIGDVAPTWQLVSAPCTLGWLLDDTASTSLTTGTAGALHGIWLEQPREILPEASFLVCPEGLRDRHAHVPKIILRPPDISEETSGIEGPGILGWIERA